MAEAEEEPIFQIIEFINRGRPSSKKMVDIVPSNWISFDKNRGKCITKYPGPPYDGKCCALIHEMVQNVQEPINEWPTFTIKFRGEASKSI